MRHYNLMVPDELFVAVQEIADAEKTTIVDFLRKSIKLGLLAYKIQKTENAALILREGERERELLML